MQKSAVILYLLQWIKSIVLKWNGLLWDQRKKSIERWIQAKSFRSPLIIEQENERISHLSVYLAIP